MNEFERAALYNILDNIKAGKRYGKDCTNVRYPYFHAVLYKQNGFIGYNHYGSSAVKPTIAELLWIIEVIFGMTVKEFLEEYILEENSITRECF